MIDLSPPFELTLPARRHFDRIAKRCYQQGRWDVIDVELLPFTQQLTLYQECLTVVLADGVCVEGARERERVRHPLLTPLSQTLGHLTRLARAIPLANADADVAGNAIDAWIDELVSDVSA